MHDADTGQSCDTAGGCDAPLLPPPAERTTAGVDDVTAPSRRRLLACGGRLLAYSAPLVLLYKPRSAFATFIPYSFG